MLRGCLALLGSQAVPSQGPVDIIIEGKTIAEIKPTGNLVPDGKVIDASRRLVTAGLINGHHHSHENFHKGRYDKLPLELWMNYVRPLEPFPLTPRQIYLRTMIGAIEALRSGTTTIADDMNVSPLLREDHVEAAYQAYEDIGIRALVGITLFDRPFFRGVPFVDEEFPKDLLRELDSKPKSSPDKILGFARKLATTRHPDFHRVGYIAAPSAPQRCSEGFLLKVRSLADEYDLPTMIHVQETRLQVVTGKLFYGSTMVEYLDRIGFLKPKTTLIHGVWLNPREIELLSKSGVTIQYNPISNLKLGSGLTPMRALLDAGVNVSLASDGCGSIETVHMLKVVQAAALTQKLRGEDYTRWIGAKEAWLAGTTGSAHAIGRGKDLGALEVGRLADLAVYRLDRIPFVPLNNPLNHLVYGETGENLDMVFVDGEMVMKEGKLTRINEAAIIDEILEEHANLLPLIEQSEKQVETIRAAYERIYHRCSKEAIAEDTYHARFRA